MPRSWTYFPMRSATSSYRHQPNATRRTDRPSPRLVSVVTIAITCLHQLPLSKGIALKGLGIHCPGHRQPLACKEGHHLDLLKGGVHELTFSPLSSVISLLTASHGSLSSLSTALQMVRNFSGGTPQISKMLSTNLAGQRSPGGGEGDVSDAWGTASRITTGFAHGPLLVDVKGRHRGGVGVAPSPHLTSRSLADD